MEIPPLPKSFNLAPFLGQWVRWSRVERCFWPGRGERAAKVDPELAPIRHVGGIYILAWSESPLGKVSPTDAKAIYIGETSEFRDRMAAWGRSAGFWGDRQKGHYAAWRWKKGSEHLWVAFFDLQLPEATSRRLAKHVRLYYEIMATEEFRVAHGKLPLANEWEQVDQI
jgi:hypothetical protein